MPKIPRPQKARRLNDIFVPQIPRFRRRGGLEFFVGFSGFAFYVIIIYFAFYVIIYIIYIILYIILYIIYIYNINYY